MPDHLPRVVIVGGGFGGLAAAKALRRTAVDGVAPSPAGKWLAVDTDRAGRVKVQPDLSVPGHPDVFVVGDTASLQQDGKPLPGVAQVAMQQGRYAGKLIHRRLSGKPAPRPFSYFDKGKREHGGCRQRVCHFADRARTDQWPHCLDGMGRGAS